MRVRRVLRAIVSGVVHRSATVTYHRRGDLIKTVTLAARGSAFRMFDDDAGVFYNIETDATEVRIIDDECRLIDRVEARDLIQSPNNHRPY